MTIPRRPYWPTIANLIHRMCIFITRHQQTLIAVVRQVAPAKESLVTDAFACLNTACALFIEIQTLVDPNWKPS